jgi:hypothetical protein
MNADVTEEDRKAKSEFEEFASQALRSARKSAYQNTLAAMIIKATMNSDRLQKIVTICEAAYFCEKKEKLNVDLVNVCYGVAQSLISTAEKKAGGMDGVFIGWSFEQNAENWKKYVEPWQRCRLRTYPLATRYGQKRFPSRVGQTPINIEEQNKLLEANEYASNQILMEIDALPPSDAFYEKTGILYRGSFYALQAEFTSWALGKLLPILTEITNQISPSIYSEIFKSMSGGQTAKKYYEAESPNASDLG